MLLLGSIAFKRPLNDVEQAGGSGTEDAVEQSKSRACLSRTQSHCWLLVGAVME